MKLLKWFLSVYLLVSLTSCLEFENLEFHGIEQVKMPKMDDSEILIDLSIKVENPNKFNIKLKPSQIEVFLSERKLGTIHLDQKLKFLKKVENTYSTQLKIKLEDGAFFALLKMATKDQIPLRFKGKIKGSVFGVSKKIEIDQVKKFSPKDLNFLKKS